MAKRKPNRTPPIFIRPTARERKAIVEAARKADQSINSNVRQMIRERYNLEPATTAESR